MNIKRTSSLVQSQFSIIVHLSFFHLHSCRYIPPFGSHSRLSIGLQWPKSILAAGGRHTQNSVISRHSKQFPVVFACARVMPLPLQIQWHASETADRMLPARYTYVIICIEHFRGDMRLDIDKFPTGRNVDEPVDVYTSYQR
jgi:hypothetical protein